MRAFFCLFALLCALNAHALAGTPESRQTMPTVTPQGVRDAKGASAVALKKLTNEGTSKPETALSGVASTTPNRQMRRDTALGISGEWHYYGNQADTVRIDEESGIMEDDTTRTSYVLLEEQGADWRRAVKKGGSYPGDTRKILRVHKDVLLFTGVKNPILVRTGAHFRAPKEKIRGRWHYAAQMNEAYYYDAEFDLDAKKMVDISRSSSGGHTRSEGRPLEPLMDARHELALRADGAVYHFTRLGADFLVLEPMYAASARNGYKILMKKAQTPRSAKQAQQKKW